MKNLHVLALAVLWACILSDSYCAAAQNDPEPVNAGDPRLSFSFPVRTGREAFRFHVQLDKAGNITGAAVFKGAASNPFQMLAACGGRPFEPLTKNWSDDELSLLVTHADFNFDGFEDVELLIAYIPHLDKKLYCVYLWDEKAGRFLYSSAISDEAVNPVVHPESKTITMHELWTGVSWQDSTYRWKGANLELIEQNGVLGDWSMRTDKDCGVSFSCSRLVNREMVVTLEKQICEPEDLETLPACPAEVKPPASKRKKNAKANQKNQAGITSPNAH